MDREAVGVFREDLLYVLEKAMLLERRGEPLSLGDFEKDGEGVELCGAL